MGEEAKIVIIKRTGADGPHFPLRRQECLFGRDPNCDLRVQLPGVAMEHAKVIRSEDNSCEFYLEILTDNEILVNGNLLKERVQLSNMDVFSIAERSFRFECNQGKEKSESKSPKKNQRSAGILQDVNELSVKDSPRTPHPRHPSLRESLGNLRRQSVPFKEEEESNSPNNSESKENDQVYIVHSVVSPKKLPSSHTPKSSKRNSKRVSFGPVLSPEQFNKDFPVKTPVRKGATPRRLSTPFSKSCISPARRRRYSVAAPMFASKIEEERESDSDEESKTNVESEENPSIENQVTSSSKSPKSKRKKMSTPLRKEIEEGAKFRQRTEQMATPLKNAIKQGFRLRPSKKKLQTPLKREIKAGLSLRQTKKKLATPIRQAIEEKPSLRATRDKMATPIRKEIETKPSLRPTRKVMDKELQKEIANGVALRKTNKVMPKDLQQNIKAGRKLKKIKRRMKPALQEEITVGKEKLRKTKNKMATPVRKEIAKGVTLKTTKRRMATTLQDEIKSGTTALRQAKKSLKTPLRKAIENGIQLRATANKAKQQKDPEASSKTPKRRHSSIDDDDEERSSQAVSKNLKTPSRKTPRPAGFHPRTRSVRRSTRRKSTKQVPSYAEILKRPKLTAKRRLTGRRTSLYQFQAEQQVATKATVKSSTKATTATKVSKLKSKTPTRRKSQARLAKTSNNKKSEDEWQVVVNKRKIKRIKRQRAVKSQQENEEQDIVGVDVLFKTPKPVRAKTDSQSTKTDTSTDEKSCATVSPNLGRKSLGLAGMRRLVETPKEESEVRLNGLRELMKTPKEEEKITSPCNYEEMKRMFSTPIERSGASVASPNDSILYGVSRLLKTPKVRTSQAVSYEGVAELFEEFEMAMPLKATGTPSLRETAETMTVVAFTTPSCTPSLRKRTDKNEVVAPLQSSNTPSLRNARLQDVAFPLQSSNTPSLRNARLQDVAFPLQSSNTPSLRNARLQDVSFPLQSSNTPSLRNARLQDVSFPLQSSNTPSLRNARGNALMVSSPVQTIPVASSKKVADKVETLESPADDIVPETSPQLAPEAATGRRTTRSKRKVEPESLPAAKRPRRTRTKETASTETSEPKTGPEKRGSRRTRAKNESDNVVPEIPTNNAVQHPVKTRGKRTAAADLVEPKAKSSKLAPESFVPEKKSQTRRGRPTNDDDVVVVVVVENKNNDSNKRATRSLRNKPNDNPAVEVEEETKSSEAAAKQVFATPKISARSSRKSKNVPGIPETPQPLEVARTKLETIVEMPTPASSIRGNAAGPLVTAVRSSRGRGKSVEVISSKNAEASLKVPTRNSRSRRGKTDVEEKGVEEAPEAPTQAGSVKLASRNSRSSRRKRNVHEETEKEELADAIPKRSSRRTKPMVPIVEEEIKHNKITPDAPAAKRTTRGQNNNRKVNEVVKVRGKKREREVEEVMPEVEPVGLGDQSNGGVRSTRPKRGAAATHEEKVEAKKQGVMGNSVKLPRRGRKMNENEKSSDDGEENGKNKRGVASSTTKQVTKKEEAGRGKNAKKQTVKNDEKAAISPAPTRVTRSRRNK